MNETVFKEWYPKRWSILLVWEQVTKQFFNDPSVTWDPFQISADIVYVNQPKLTIIENTVDFALIFLILT